MQCAHSRVSHALFVLTVCCSVVFSASWGDAAPRTKKARPTPVSVTPVPKPTVDPFLARLNAAYFKLRNTDIEVRKRAEWEEIADGYKEFIARDKRAPGIATALLRSGVIHEQIARAHDDDDEKELAREFYQRVVTEFPRSGDAVEALLYDGDLVLYAERDEELALERYRAAIALAPDSQIAVQARGRIDKIEGRGDAEPARKARNLKGPLIMLDPGHGGEDDGAAGPRGILEKEITLDVARRVERLLTDRLGAVVRLTRREDTFVPLAERANLANDFEADLFVSLHANASADGSLQGLESYYLDNSDDKASKALAERENSSMRFEEGAEGDLQFMLSDLIQNAKLDDSIRLASALQSSVAREVAAHWGAIRSLGVKKAPFYVLVGAHMPCALVEMFFIDNPIEGARLSNPKFREDLARGIYLGITQFLKERKKY